MLWLFGGQPPSVYAQGNDGVSIYHVALSCSGVPVPCYTSVQDAVDAADDPGDLIKVAAGTYTGINNLGGMAQVVYISKIITIRGGYTTSNWTTPDPEANLTELNAQTLGRVMFIAGPDVNVTVEGLRLTYGNATGITGGEAGGGLRATEATVTLNHTWIMSNTTPSSGGGVYMKDGLATIENCAIQNNRGEEGAALRLSGMNASIKQSAIQDNTATSGTPRGSVINITGSGSLVTLVNNILQDNKSNGVTTFGAIYLKDGQASLIGNQILNNTKSGGVYAEFAGVITLTNNVIQGHSDPGVFVYATDSVLINNTIDDNHPGVHIDQVGGNVTTLLERNLIQNNQNETFGAKGGGVYLHSRGAPLTLTNNIIQDNISGLDPVAPHGNGGGVYIEGNNIILQGNIIRRNRANEFCHSITGCLNQGRGGGIYVSSNADDALLVNNIITNNQAEGKGSGICIIGSSPTLYHNTIANNGGPVDPEAIGVYVGHTSSGQVSQPKFYNTILAGQAAGIEVNGDDSNIAVIDGILWWGNTINTSGGGTFLITNEDTGNPAFANPAGYDYHIVGPGSAAVDAGIDKGTTNDVDGQTRPHYGGYDLGADEWWPLVVVETASPDTVAPGDVVTYTLALTNTTDMAMSVRLTDTLSSYVNYLGPLNCNNGDGEYASGVVAWTGTVFSTTPTIISFAVQIASDAPSIITGSVVISDIYGRFQADPAPILVESSSRKVYLPVILCHQS
ncbi:MAG: right-handed parallel beta-helix repeat-containing protein [Anaerolineae bacterium]|nr:right-handed parallel beta-helix repeat-containing protein [Anaerolineae bacterium]